MSLQKATVKMAVKTSGIVLLCLLNSILGIPLNQFYPFGTNSNEANRRVAVGFDTSSARIFTQTLYCFYNRPQISVIVSSVLL